MKFKIGDLVKAKYDYYRLIDIIGFIVEINNDKCIIIDEDFEKDGRLYEKEGIGYPINISRGVQLNTCKLCNKQNKAKSKRAIKAWKEYEYPNNKYFIANTSTCIE